MLVSDFQTFDLYDLDTDEAVSFRLADLPAHVERFGFMMGVERREFRDQDPANLIATELMATLHDSLKASGYDGHELEVYLVRLLFCLFAEDTGIFPRDAFETLIRDRTREDGSDLGPLLAQLFDVLNTDRPKRQAKLDEDLDAFDYINGALFAERLPVAAFDAAMRDQLLDVCGFGWNTVSPAIFGSLFQGVMNAKERRKKGAHYTTEKNILKLIRPLFLDDLRAELDALKVRRDNARNAALNAFIDRLGRLTFLDPACGCGNFLVTTVADRHLVVREESRPINGAPRLVIGSKPIDGGWLIFSDDERQAVILRDARAARFLRPYLGAEDYINGGGRWIIAAQGASPSELRALPDIAERVRAVREFRRGDRPARGKSEEDTQARGISSRALADTPTAFHVTVIPDQPFLALPEVSSERRDYIPIGWLEPPTIPSNKLRVLLDADLWDFGLLTSAMHMSWLRHIKWTPEE